MHIPDGFISPLAYIPATAVAAGLLFFAAKRSTFDDEKLSFLASLSSFSFILMMITIPLPGGTSAHLSGIALLAIVFGPLSAALAASLVLVVEAVVFGEGGITTLGINIIAIAFIESFVSYGLYSLFRKRGEAFGVFIAAFFAVVSAAAFMSIFLGLQSLISPNFFPFSIKSTLSAIMLPHLFIGLLEGFITLAIYKFLKKNYGVIFDTK